jgi:hypothetical protein
LKINFRHRRTKHTSSPLKTKKKREIHFGPLRKGKALRLILKLVNQKGERKKKEKRRRLVR